jgi:hypothetical protein
MTRIDYAGYSRNVAMYLRDRCKRENIKQDTWQGLFGFSKQAVNSWRGGRGFPSFENLLTIAGHFDEKLDVIVKWRTRRIS